MKVGLHQVVCLIHFCSCVCFHAADWDYYAILQVKRSATNDVIRRAFINLSIRLHPDKNRCDPQANDKMTLLNVAHDTLKNKKSRQNYNSKYPKAGIIMEPYDWEIPECSGNQLKAEFSTYIHIFIGNTRKQMHAGLKKCIALTRNIAALVLQWILAIVKRSESMNADENTKNFVYGILVAATASFVCTSPLILFILLWIIVLTNLHFLLMIWVTIQYIRNIKIKYFPCLVILWIIYRYILHQIDSILSLDLGFWKAFSLHQYLSLLAVYVVASVMATAYIFWTYKPHQNHYIAFIIYFLQLALALGFIFQAKLHKTDFDVLLCLVKIIVISKIVTKIALYVWLYIKEIFKMATNFILYSLKGLAKIIMKIMSFSATLPLNFIKACYKSFKKAVKICYNATKTFAKTVFPWIWVVASFTGRVWSKCVLIFPRTSSKYTQICLDLTAVSIWYTMYFCGVMRVWFQKLVSTIKQLCMCVQTEIMINGARRLNNPIQGCRLLTNVEYVIEGHFYTQAQLNRLRRDCQQTGFNVWREAGFLSDVKRFSSFISSGDHVTDAEREEHHRSSHVYPCAKATDSESSEESD